MVFLFLLYISFDCYFLIIWQMARQLHKMIEENNFQSPPGFEEEGSFLKTAIEPIYKVLQKVSI